MPGQGNPIVVGGGIALGSPAVIGNFLKLTSITPPAANVSTRLIERASSIEVLGDGTTSTAIGNGADANDTNHIAIGTNVVTRAATGKSIVIGESTTIPAASGTNNIYIGSTTFSGVISGSDAIVIGQNVTVSTAANSSSVAIGNSMTVAGNSSVIVGSSAGVTGNGSVAIGASASASLNGIAIGQLATTGTGGAVNNIVIGASAGAGSGTSGVLLLGNRNGAAGPSSNTAYIGFQDNANSVFTTAMFLGGGPTHQASTVVPAFTLTIGRDANGANIAASDVTIRGQRATGNAANGNIVFQVGITGGAGSAIATATTAMRILAGAAPQVEMSVDRGLIFVSQTNQAGVAAGTLGNAPAAGNPAFWLPVIVNGTNRAIPCW